MIRGREALRILPASAQTAGTAVSLLPPQKAASNNPSLSLQATHDRAQSSLASLRTIHQEHMSRFQLEEISEGQQFVLRNLRRNALEGPARIGQEAVVPVVANEGTVGTATLPLQETAARPPQESTSLVDTMSGAADTSSSMESDMLHWDMSTAESRAAWHAERREALAQRKAESEAAARGETLPPVANPSSAMQLHLSGLEARRVRQQRQAADILARSANAVADMQWCIDNLDAIRTNVGDSRHSDRSDFWEADYNKSKPWAKNTFVPKRLALGTNSLCAPFYHAGPDAPDDRDPPHFRVSAELFGRMLHTLGREYISKDDNRKISAELNKHLAENVAKVQGVLDDAGKIVTDRHQLLIKQHEDMMVQSRQAIEAASLAYRVEMAKQTGLLEEHTETCRSMTSGMGTAFSNVRGKILSVDVNRRIQLDAEELRLYAELKRIKISELALKEQVAKMEAELDQEKVRRPGWLTTLGLSSARMSSARMIPFMPPKTTWSRK